MTFLGVQATGDILSACKTGMDRINVTSVTQSLSLWRKLLLRSKNSSDLLKCFCFGRTLMYKALWDRIGNLFLLFFKLEIVCDTDTV